MVEEGGDVVTVEGRGTDLGKGMLILN